jgi:hypothetical protein
MHQVGRDSRHETITPCISNNIYNNANKGILRRDHGPKDPGFESRYWFMHGPKDPGFESRYWFMAYIQMGRKVASPCALLARQVRATLASDSRM